MKNFFRYFLFLIVLAVISFILIYPHLGRKTKIMLNNEIAEITQKANDRISKLLNENRSYRKVRNQYPHDYANRDNYYSGRADRSNNRIYENREKGGGLINDTKNYGKSVYNATKEGYNIMNEDPRKTADKLMHDKQYQNKIGRDIRNLQRSSERMNEHINSGINKINSFFKKF